MVRIILLPRKWYLWLPLLATLFFPSLAHSSEIVILNGQNLAPFNEAAKAFTREIDGDVELFDMGGDAEKGKEIARLAVAAHPRLILAIGTKASLAAAEATASIPIVSLLVSRPEVYLQGKKNVAGISLNPDPREQFRLLKQLCPEVKTIGVVSEADGRSQELKDGKKAAGSYEIMEKTVSSESETPAAVRKALESSDALWLVMDDKVISEQSLKYIVTTSVERNRPVIGFSKSIVKRGALFSVYTDFDDMGRQGAVVAKRILAGEPPEGISFVYPKPSGFALNLRTAKLIGLSMPASVARKAGEKYE